MLSLEEINLKLDRIEAAQSVLLAAIHDFQEMVISTASTKLDPLHTRFEEQNTRMTAMYLKICQLAAPPAKQGKAGHKPSGGRHRS